MTWRETKIEEIEGLQILPLWDIVNGQKSELGIRQPPPDVPLDVMTGGDMNLHGFIFCLALAGDNIAEARRLYSEVEAIEVHRMNIAIEVRQYYTRQAEQYRRDQQRNTGAYY